MWYSLSMVTTVRRSASGKLSQIEAGSGRSSGGSIAGWESFETGDSDRLSGRQRSLTLVGFADSKAIFTYLNGAGALRLEELVIG